MNPQQHTTQPPPSQTERDRERDRERQMERDRDRERQMRKESVRNAEKRRMITSRAPDSERADNERRPSFDNSQRQVTELEVEFNTEQA
jgi:hypothetical protein